MKINQYDVFLCEDKIPYLVKNNSFEYEYDAFNTPDVIIRMMNMFYDLENRAEEYVYLLALDNQFKCLGVFEVSHGTQYETTLSPRCVCMRALLCGASSVVIMHNHPSGSRDISSGDKKNTELIGEALNRIGISLTDHIVVFSGGYASFREHRLIGIEEPNLVLV